VTEPDASSPIDIEPAANRVTARMLGRIGNSDTADEAASRFGEDVRAEGRGLASRVLERADRVGVAVERERADHRVVLARLWGRAFDQYLAVARLADEAVSHVLKRRQNQARRTSDAIRRLRSDITLIIGSSPNECCPGARAPITRRREPVAMTVTVTDDARGGMLGR
jgi:hypothetical protein